MKKIAFFGICYFSFSILRHQSIYWTKTLALVPNSQLFPMAFQECSQFLEHDVVNKRSQMVKMLKDCSGSRKYLNANGYPGLSWIINGNTTWNDPYQTLAYARERLWYSEFCLYTL